jgi:hypothetical protein
MHSVDQGIALALAVIAHAWIGRIQGPAPIVNVVAWVMVILLMLAVVFGLPVLR